MFIQEILLAFQIKKLKTELGVVRSNLTMMSDMMSQLDPVTVKQADMELLEVKKTNRHKPFKMSSSQCKKIISIHLYLATVLYP